jgi:hypothetical protein
MHRALAVTAMASMLVTTAPAVARAVPAAAAPLAPVSATASDSAGATSARDSAAAPARAAAPSPPAAPTPAAAPAAFPQQTFHVAARHGHRLAYVAIVTGAALVGASFAITHHADQIYDHYLTVTTPEQAQQLYDSTRRWDQLSTATLLTGEGLVLAGLWFRFLGHDAMHPMSVGLSTAGCALSLSF